MEDNIRLPAQWEKQNFIQIVFPHKDTDWNDYLKDAIDTFVNIVNIIAKYEKCLVVAKDLVYIKSLFKNIRIKKNITFVRIDSNDTWSRDFGGITVANNGNMTVLDFKFNAWGKKFEYKLDNKITQQLKLKGLLKQYKHKTIPFVLEGGSIDSDGEGTILTTTKCLMEKNRNPTLTKNSIEKQLINTLGAKRILWLSHGSLAGDDTDSHIDTLARFVSPTIIVYQTCDDVNDTNYLELKRMEDELKIMKTMQGIPYKLIPLPHIKAKYYEDDRLPATYVNFLIINGAIIVPTYNDKNDTIAIEIFKKIFKDKDVIGCDCSILIRQHGSLHCVTMQYPAI